MHGAAEEGVDAGLVAGAGAFEPGEDVGVDADGDGAFDGAVELGDYRAGPVGELGASERSILWSGRLASACGSLADSLGRRRLIRMYN